jgi:hypothetical protein
MVLITLMNRMSKLLNLNLRLSNFDMYNSTV